MYGFVLGGVHSHSELSAARGPQVGRPCSGLETPVSRPAGRGLCGPGRPAGRVPDPAHSPPPSFLPPTAVCLWGCSGPTGLACLVGLVPELLTLLPLLWTVQFLNFPFPMFYY